MKVHPFAATAALLLCAEPALAQSAPTYIADTASPFGASTVTNADAASVTMPKLDFTAGTAGALDFNKYYAFYRANTDFATAYADIVECDGYARGLRSGGGKYQEAPYPYAGTMAGVIGGALANALIDAINAPAEKRRMRRINIRTCMNYKGYERYALPKDLWTEFNFEEGAGAVADEKRHRFLLQQALVASSGKLQGEALIP